LNDQPVEATNVHYFQLEQFEGPLDLLLFLIKRSEINIHDIPIHQITEQYLQFLQYATRVDLDNLTEFYSMAATLLLIKSRMLLPADIDDDEMEDPRQDLVDRLIEYQRYKKLSELMTEKDKSTEWVIEPRSKQRAFEFVEDEELWQSMDVWDLLQTFSTLMRNLSPERIIDLYEEVSVNEKLSLLYELVEKKGEFVLDDLIVRPESPMDVVCAFFALLEAVKAKAVVIMQNRMFGDIRIKGRAPGDV
jgi:segregation and condensation protein A